MQQTLSRTVSLTFACILAVLALGRADARPERGFLRLRFLYDRRYSLATVEQSRDRDRPYPTAKLEK